MCAQVIGQGPQLCLTRLEGHLVSTHPSAGHGSGLEGEDIPFVTTGLTLIHQTLIHLFLSRTRHVTLEESKTSLTDLYGLVG